MVCIFTYNYSDLLLLSRFIKLKKENSLKPTAYISFSNFFVPTFIEMNHYMKGKWRNKKKKPREV